MTLSPALSFPPLTPGRLVALPPAVGPLSARRILVVGGDPAAQAFSATALRGAGAEVDVVRRGADALVALARLPYDLVFLDLDLPEVDAPAVLGALPSLRPAARAVVVAGEEEVGVAAVEAMRRGAADYLVKPVCAEALVNAAVAVLARSPAPAASPAGSRMVGRSAAMRRVLEQAERVAATGAPVLVTGESGTGKERLARLVHELSPRAGGPFVAARCATVDERQLEAELFGARDRPSECGLIERAHGGTLFLDEVGALAPALQVRLLQVLEERQLRRPSGGAPAVLDIRIVAASTGDLAAEVAAGRFRKELFFRLNVVPLAMPALRERADDIPLLVADILAALAAERGAAPPDFGDEALARMAAYHWPGNVRELENAVRRAVILHGDARTLPFDPPGGAPAATGERALLAHADECGWDLARLEREYILAVLERTRGHQSRAAQRLGIDRRTLYRKLREYGVR